jgi:amiloride-sensitive sodium channel subunit beta
MLRVKPGLSTSIAREKSVTTTLPPPHGQCMEIITGYQCVLLAGLLKRGFKYRKVFCMKKCNSLYAVRQCNCRPASDYNWFNTSRVCSTTQDLECIESVDRYLAENANAPDCDEQCPLECEITEYKYTISTSDYPTHAWASYLSTIEPAKNIFAANNRSFSYEAFKRSAVSIDIFFNSLHYMSITDSPDMSLLDLISNFGGLLGLFLGMSLLSVIECVEISIKIASILFDSSTRPEEIETAEANISKNAIAVNLN